MADSKPTIKVIIDRSNEDVKSTWTYSFPGGAVKAKGGIKTEVNITDVPSIGKLIDELKIAKIKYTEVKQNV